jgi:hypothetical protein
VRDAGSDLPPLPASPPTARTAPTPPAPPAAPVTPVPIVQGAGSTPQPDAPEDGLSETLAVLQAVERGELSIDEAMERLATLEGGAQP